MHTCVAWSWAKCRPRPGSDSSAACPASWSRDGFCRCTGASAGAWASVYLFANVKTDPLITIPPRRHRRHEARRSESSHPLRSESSMLGPTDTLARRRSSGNRILPIRAIDPHASGRHCRSAGGSRPGRVARRQITRVAGPGRDKESAGMRSTHRRDERMCDHVMYTHG